MNLSLSAGSPGMMYVNFTDVNVGSVNWRLPGPSLIFGKSVRERREAEREIVATSYVPFLTKTYIVATQHSPPQNWQIFEQMDCNLKKQNFGIERVRHWLNRQKINKIATVIKLIWIIANTKYLKIK